MEKFNFYFKKLTFNTKINFLNTKNAIFQQKTHEMGSTAVDTVSKNAKRGREPALNEEDDPKKPKIEATPVQLVDINEDCLQVIFQHLDVIDLINVADTNNRFISAAVSVYHRCHRTKGVTISNGCYCHHKIPIPETLATSFFRHFDHEVSAFSVNLSCIDYELNIEQFLQPNRLTALVELELYSFDETDFDTFVGPFETVEQLTIVSSWLNENLAKLNVWFPNVNTLKLYNVKTMWIESLEVHYPKLKHLTIYHNKTEIPHSSIIEVVRLNQQLESLSLHSDIDEDFIRCIEKYSKQLKQLDLCTMNDQFFNFYDKDIHFDNVETFTFTCDFVMSIPFTFNNLQELNLQGFYLQSIDVEFKNQLVQFFAQNANLIKVNLDFYEGAWDDIELEDVTEIVKSLPKLSELKFRADAFQVDDLVQFLTEHIALNKIQLSFIDPDRYQFVRDEIQVLGAKWTINTHNDASYDYIDFERK